MDPILFNLCTNCSAAPNYFLVGTQILTTHPFLDTHKIIITI